MGFTTENQNKSYEDAKHHTFFPAMYCYEPVLSRKKKKKVTIAIKEMTIARRNIYILQATSGQKSAKENKTNDSKQESTKQVRHVN